jgi:putative membrane protein
VRRPAVACRLTARFGPAGSIGPVEFVVRVLVSALTLWLVVWLFDDITLVGANDTERVLTLLATAVIFAVVNSVVAPVVKILSIPFIIVTLGLMLLVINALMLLLTSWFAGVIGLGFHVEGFWTAVWASIVISLASWALNGVLSEDRR